MSWKEVSSGIFASEPGELEGPIRKVIGLQQIVALMKESLGEPVIIVTNVAGGSAVSTIIKRAKAIVSLIGGPNSHIVVVARDYQVPCIVGARTLDLEALENGQRMRLRTDGGIDLWQPAAI
jgi:phosphoenolpyruvate-protein kinase (PTS system EI component)